MTITKEWIAMEIAKRIHKNQKRYDHSPYINHIKNVLEILRHMNINNEVIIITATLHDVLEDCKKEEKTKLELEIMRKFGEEVLMNLQYLTNKELNYQYYIEDLVSYRPNIIVVKIADMIQNLTETPTKKQREKYLKAFPLLIMGLLTNTQNTK